MLSLAIVSEGMTFLRESDSLPGIYEEIAEVVSWSGPGGSSAEYEVTHLKSTAKEVRLGHPDEGTLTLELNFIPKSASHIALRADRALRRQKNYRIIYTDTFPASAQDFSGYVTGFSTTGGVDSKVGASITIAVTGDTIIAASPPPVNFTVPTISGPPEVGETLTASHGTWDNVGTLTLQWLADGSSIAGATGLTFVIQEAQEGFVISLQETDTTGGGSVTVTSLDTAPVTNPAMFAVTFDGTS